MFSCLTCELVFTQIKSFKYVVSASAIFTTTWCMLCRLAVQWSVNPNQLKLVEQLTNCTITCTSSRAYHHGPDWGKEIRLGERDGFFWEGINWSYWVLWFPILCLFNHLESWVSFLEFLIDLGWRLRTRLNNIFSCNQGPLMLLFWKSDFKNCRIFQITQMLWAQTLWKEESRSFYPLKTL